MSLADLDVSDDEQWLSTMKVINPETEAAKSAVILLIIYSSLFSPLNI